VLDALEPHSHSPLQRWVGEINDKDSTLPDGLTEPVIRRLIETYLSHPEGDAWLSRCRCPCGLGLPVTFFAACPHCDRPTT
jgi:hypothetical protein